MSPSTLENLGFFIREGENGQEGLSETQKKMSGMCRITTPAHPSHGCHIPGSPS